MNTRQDADDVPFEVGSEAPSQSPRPRAPRSRLVGVLSIVVVLLIVLLGAFGYYAFQQIQNAQQPQTMSERTIQDLEKQLAADPQNADVSFRLAAAYFDTKQYDKTVDVLKKVESNGATDTVLARAIYGVGKVDETRGNISAAIDSYKRSLGVTPTVDALYSLGMIDMQRKQYADAIVNLKRFVVLNPQAGDVLYTLGQAYEQTGDKPNALAAYQQAEKFTPDNPAIAIAIKRLGGKQ
jgi:tetratricopeptide (TPR) repeat protein